METSKFRRTEKKENNKNCIGCGPAYRDVRMGGNHKRGTEVDPDAWQGEDLYRNTVLPRRSTYGKTAQVVYDHLGR